ncbi:DUF4307 domain-containing protein [Streptomyces sp. HNM0574]|uniref:DUF4307 domain-containing protein n=1 Tax=Streptomyces sp. HNM0574 TaxID=2714954 RepID=UPI00146A7EB7|nr:DUF4307 domain-containing protein [Streptomyces sp. HNM0574]NLU66699.1 DUF4307 domain-containing protein [Streptomyces sp. HNM0574]
MADLRTGSSSSANPSAGSAGSGRAAVPPEGRYGRVARGDEARTDRRLKITGAVLGALMVALIAWIGAGYISSQGVSGELIKFKVVSDEAVEAHLEVRKDKDASGVCTLRTQEESGAEVGRKAVRVKSGEERIDSVVTVRTTARATSAELVGCEVTSGD